MAKKRTNAIDWLKKYGIIPAVIIGCLTALGVGIRHTYKWITVVERVEAGEVKQKETEKRVDSIERYIDVQQTANELVQKHLENKKEIIYSQDGKWFWNGERQEWRPIKELKKEGD